MKTDNYLSLCLEQAAKSPLHYRHGAIVVRGGKVIGHGHNDYRPGFDGGCLKHGRVAGRAPDKSALVELKEKLKKKREKSQSQQQQDNSKDGIFVPFEGTGGGPAANSPLSMHSEMMAIYSALHTSSTLSSSAFSRSKPCFKIPGGDKRKARLRRAALESYVNTLCASIAGTAALGSSKRQVQENNKEDQEADESVDRRWAFLKAACGEKPHQKKRYGKKAAKNRNENGRSGSRTLAQHSQAWTSAPKQDSDVHDDMDARYHASMSNRSNATDVAVEMKFGKGKRDHYKPGMVDLSSAEIPRSQPLLLHKGRARDGGVSLAKRQNHPKLRGADLYVTRLGHCGVSGVRPPKASRVQPPPKSSVPSSPSGDDITALGASVSPLTSSSSSPSSLHDELLNRKPSPSPIPIKHTHDEELVFDRNQIHASRPCYRCITFMHSVGIKRVFWTNDAGEWEGGKVRDLFDALEAGMEEDAARLGGPMGNGLFVTKHEVLMLKRMMGEKGD